MDALEILSPDVRERLMAYAAQSSTWADYLLLVAACCEIIQGIPLTEQAFRLLNAEEVLEHSLEQLGNAIGAILPGGAEEFASYMPSS